MRFVLTGLLVLVAAFQSFAAEPTNALDALKLLPKEQAQNLVRIIGRDGTPQPERWYFLVHNPSSATGVREFVVAGGEIVASRDISQFAETLKADETMSLDAVAVDSGDIIKLVEQYALANNVTVAKVNYQLGKEGAEAAPVWKATCQDDSGKQIAELVVTAGKGTIVSHEGFKVEPAADKPKFDVYATSQVAPSPAKTSAAISTQDDSSEANQASEEENEEPRQRRRRLSRENDDGDRGERRREQGVKGKFKKVGGKLQRFFTGRNTIED